MEFADEEVRKLLYEEQMRKRASFRRFLASEFQGDPAEVARLEENFNPLKGQIDGGRDDYWYQVEEVECVPDSWV